MLRQRARNSLNNREKIQEEARFKILRLLHDNPELTQRELGERVGISLGAVNYSLRALIERESARRLARVGGSEPRLEAAPRRRAPGA